MEKKDAFISFNKQMWKPKFGKFGKFVLCMVVVGAVCTWQLINRTVLEHFVQEQYKCI
tara:strand:+ start:481 stop:654 length:174 start_codon:yes stop_codon:yes gene_type:complete